jgi:hypothetical protein
MIDGAEGMMAQEPSPEDRGARGKFWAAELRAAEQREQSWRQRCEKIIKRYKDADRTKRDNRRRFNILHSNVQTILPSVYSQTPKPSVKRRHKDKDPVARMASQMLERSLMACADLYDVDVTIEAAVMDRLLVGRGQSWVVYEPQFQTDPMGYDIKAGEQVRIMQVHWKDYAEAPGRCDEEIWWRARRIYLTRRELVERFGQVGATIKLDHTPEGAKEHPAPEQVNKATVWEVWDKTSGNVLFVAPGSEENGLLQEAPAPINFQGFFPCPAPMRGTVAGDDLIPTPDYVIYQDQADELDELTERIGLMQKALAVRGVYDASVEGLQRLLSDADNNELIPIDNFALFGERGGLKGSVDFLPIGDIVVVLQRLYEARDRMKADLYEISGIADIMRGSGDPNETATAQQIKANWGSKRVRRLQKDVQRFVRDLYRLKAEIMAEHFDAQTLVSLAGLEITTPQQMQMAQAAKQLLATESARLYRIEIETDSTIEADEQAEKAGATEFVTAVTGFLKEAGAIAGQSPALTGLMGELLLFAVRRFPKGASMEEAVEEAMRGVAQERAQAAQRPPQPDPKMMRVQQQGQADQARLQLDAQKAMAEDQRERQRIQLDATKAALSAQRDAMNGGVL